jgi:peptidoglycan/xylan/chitin deacetylase (PgdA/CDA1 family)
MIKLIRRSARDVLNTATNLLPRATRNGDTLILAYHNVIRADESPAGDRSLHLPLWLFERQLDIVRREADVVPLLDVLTRDDARRRRVAITFDDAYVGACELGVPACIARGMPTTVFVAPALFGRFAPWDLLAQGAQWSDADRYSFLWSERGQREVETIAPFPAAVEPWLRIASASQTAALSQQKGVTIGNHSFGHLNLGVLSDDELVSQLQDAEETLKALVGRAYIPVLAYPYGIPPRSPQHSLPSASVMFGLCVSGGWYKTGAARDPYHVPRLNVPSGITASGFRRCLRGWVA